MKQNLGVLDEQFRCNLAGMIENCNLFPSKLLFDDDSHDSMMFNDFKRFTIGFEPFYF